jgi:tRNA(Glu) U13 pseudouridine synthase TruD
VVHETYFAYGALCKEYFAQKGLPEAFYSDKFGVFRVNAKNVTTTEAITQIGRALKELDIELICANTPQAKGRVERANKTFQDRLVKEMRLAKIDNYQAANQFLPTFIEKYNQKFGVQPRSSLDFYRPLPEQIDWEQLFTWQATRILSKNLQIQFEKTVYQIVSERPAYALKKREVLVAKHADGNISVFLNGTQLDIKPFHVQPKQAEVTDSKKLHVQQSRKPYSPPPDHPWRNNSSNNLLSPAPD